MAQSYLPYTNSLYISTATSTTPGATRFTSINFLFTGNFSNTNEYALTLQTSLNTANN